MHENFITSTFEPQDLAFLQKVFTTVCAERGLSGDSDAASDLAGQMFQLYQQGIREEKDLQARLRN
ncbi:hypothetical protein LH464_14175 [Neorhizobium sp. T786]|uniref:hypothetical protein n=1 Tax=Pseudorhizobium xiangyangii TaxID=2883104 RepID=UPI001CFFB375|nr:hypothetical protein [Neorhizobium xiangyangii]MCB5203621.1 hypothetical protein [Neorhizobium xiangyangii]